MNKNLLALSLVFIILPGTFSSAWAASEVINVLVLPFQENGEAISEAGYGEVTAAMMEACLSRAAGISPVERGGMDILLAEHQLSLTGLSDGRGKLKTGALAGVKVLIAGSLFSEGKSFRIDGRAFDTGTGVVIAASSLKRDRVFLAEAVHELCGTLTASLLTDDGESFKGPVDSTPAATLHFMRGLGLYHAARYEAAIGEFFHSGPEGPSRLWAARAYLALEEFANACLELQKLENIDLPDRLAKEVDDSLDICRRKMNDEEAALVRALLQR